MTQGGKVGQLSLAYGANDMGSVMIEENVVRAAGASYCMDEVEIVRNIEDAGFVAKRRNMHYEILGDPIFRERDVPRMLELATAREDGDTQRARRSCAELSRAQPRRASSSASIVPALIRYHARLGPADQRAAAPRRLGRGRSRPHRRARRRRRRACVADGARASISATSRSCPASSTRTRISSCRTCATRCRRPSQFVDLDPRRDGGAARAAGSAARRRSSTRVDAAIARVRSRPAPRSSATSATRWCTFAPLARQRARRRASSTS